MLKKIFTSGNFMSDEHDRFIDFNYTFKTHQDCNNVSELITDADIDKWSPESPVFLSTQTGTGKTSFVSEVLLPRVLKNKHGILKPGIRMVMIVNRTMLSRQLKRNLINTVAQLGFPDCLKIIRNHTSEGLDDIIDIGCISVLTYQQITADLLRNFKKEKVKYVIMDEAHFITSDSLFNAETSKIHFDILNHFSEATRIYMSATPDVAYEPIIKGEYISFLRRKALAYSELIIHPEITFQKYIRKRSKHNDFPKITTFFYDMERNFDYISNIFRIKNIKPYHQIVEIIKNSSANTKWLIFVSQKKAGEELKKAIKGYNPQKSVAFISAETKDGSSFQELVNDSQFLSDILISTSVADNGINIIDKKVKNIIIDSFDRTEFLQMLGRVRPSENQKINLFVISRSVKGIESLLKIAQRHLIERIQLCMANSDETPVFASNYILQKSGYNFDSKGVYFSQASLYNLLSLISMYRRLIRVENHDKTYFPRFTIDTEASAAQCRNYLQNLQSGLSLRTADAIESEKSFNDKKRTECRKNEVPSFFSNENNFTVYLLHKQLDLLFSAMYQEKFPQTSLADKIFTLKYLIATYEDFPDEILFSDTDYIDKQYCLWLGKPTNDLKSLPANKKLLFVDADTIPKTTTAPKSEEHYEEIIRNHTMTKETFYDSCKPTINDNGKTVFRYKDASTLRNFCLLLDTARNLIDGSSAPTTDIEKIFYEIIKSIPQKEKTSLQRILKYGMSHQMGWLGYMFSFQEVRPSSNVKGNRNLIIIIRD